jgi:hypothetical protein
MKNMEVGSEKTNNDEELSNLDMILNKYQESKAM